MRGWELSSYAEVDACVLNCKTCQVGFRLGRYLNIIVPQMLQSIDNEAPDADVQATNDLRENCFQVRSWAVA